MYLINSKPEAENPNQTFPRQLFWIGWVRYNLFFFVFFVFLDILLDSNSTWIKLKFLAKKNLIQNVIKQNSFMCLCIIQFEFE